MMPGRPTRLLGNVHFAAIRRRCQHKMLVWKLRGHCAYYGITGNASNLTTFCFHVVHIWQKWLNRRSQRKSMPWVRFLRLLKRYPLPRMTASHSSMLA